MRTNQNRQNIFYAAMRIGATKMTVVLCMAVIGIGIISILLLLFKYLANIISKIHHQKIIQFIKINLIYRI